MHCIGSDEEDSQMMGTAVKIGRTWEAVGPFPSGMREHPSMASPLSAFPFPGDADVDFASRSYDEADSWPSELPTGGRAGWTRFDVNEDGWLEVSYPEVNWDQLRSDRGWASLQYQVMLRTSLTVPAVSGLEETPLLIDLIQGTEFALIPKDKKPVLPVRWYQGDVYDLANFPAGRHASRSTSNFARGISVLPGEYVLVVRAMYEIRMFGDPGLGKGATIRLKFAAEVDTHRDKLEILEGTAIVPHVVDGWLMGKVMSVGIRASSSRSQPATITGCSLEDPTTRIYFTVTEPTTIVPGQTRPVAFTIGQNAPLHHDVRSMTLKIHVDGEVLTWVMPLVHHTLESTDAFKMTFPSSSDPCTPLPASISYAMVVPPTGKASNNATRPPPVILALHGAGVDAQSKFWTDAIPRRQGGWAVLPTGRTEWGEDWHGGSMVDVWTARDALPGVIALLGGEWSVPTETLLIGHSNGGQGAWHSAARNPDRITGLIAAAGYLKIQDYVPFTECFGDRYADPALMGILHAALAPYNNDLYASNLTGIPILAVHGAEDRNVPPRHSRAHAALVEAWQDEEKNNLLQVVEVPGEDHWWNEIFRLPEVTQFIEHLPPRKSYAEQRHAGFTVTTANVHETGTKAGIAIVAVKVPGRLARLDVNARQWRDRATSPLDLHPMNVKTIMLRGDGSSTDGEATEQILEHGPGGWVPSSSAQRGQEVDWVYPAFLSRPQGPMIRLLATTAPLAIFIGTNPLHLSIAARIAHDLYTYHRIDTQIVSPASASTGLGPSAFEGNHLMIGRPEDNVWVKALLAEPQSQIDLSKPDTIIFNGRLIDEKGVGLLALQKHLHSDTALAALLTGTDDEGLELAARLFPLRTGVPVPEWAIVSPRTRWQGAGGFIGAGFWDREWKWSECMSWMDR